MTHRSRMLAAMRGEATDRLPWAPRMDLWYIARRIRGTLDPGLVGLNTADIARRFGFGLHSIRGDFTLPRRAEDLALRGLGLDNHPDFPYRIELRGLECEVERRDDSLTTTIHTSSGKVITQLENTPEMARDGISLPFFRSHAIESISDFDAVGEVFEHLEVVPTPEAYAAYHARVGEQGVAVASGPSAASPIHLMLHELAPMDLFYYLYADEGAAMHGLAERMERFFDSWIAVLCSSAAEAVFWGANYDRDLTWPPFFLSEIAPWLRRVALRLHDEGKILITHTDGENRDLLEHYPKCDFDVAESLCPAPMTSLTLSEVRLVLGDRVAVWGGLPSVIFLPDSMDGSVFRAYLDEVFASLGTGRGLILGVSDNVPPDADLGRLERVTEMVESWRPQV